MLEVQAGTQERKLGAAGDMARSQRGFSRHRKTVGFILSVIRGCLEFKQGNDLISLTLFRDNSVGSAEKKLIGEQGWKQRAVETIIKTRQEMMLAQTWIIFSRGGKKRSDLGHLRGSGANTIS